MLPRIFIIVHVEQVPHISFEYDGCSFLTLSHVQSVSKVFTMRNRNHSNVRPERNHSNVRPERHLGASGDRSASRSFFGIKVPYLNSESWAFNILMITFEDRAFTLATIPVTRDASIVPHLGR